MAKKKTYIEKMQNKYGVTSSAFSASASGNSQNEGSYIERMNNIYGSADDNRYHQSASMDLINKRVNQRMEEERRKRAQENARIQNNFAPKYPANSVAAPLNNVNPFQRSIDNGFLPGTKSVSRKTSAAAKIDRNMDPIDNSNESYNDKYAIISGSRGSDRSSGLSKAVDKLLYGTYKEKPKSATPRGDAVKKYANNTNWGKDVTVGPVAGGMTGRKDIYEYLNDKDADIYISKSFKQGNPISSNAYGFARNNGEGDTASPGWVKQSDWYKNFANANNAEALDTSMEQIRAKLPEFDISKGINLKPQTTDSDKEVFRNMTEDEQKEYSYIFGKYGREKATAYLDTIKNKVQYRKAAELYKNWENSDGNKGKYAKALGYAATSGIDAFVRGIGEQAANAFTGSADLSAPAASEIAYQQMRGNYKGLPGIGLDLTQNTAMMAPTMIAGGVGSVLTGGATAASEIASLATTIAPMTFGSAYEEAVNTGADPEHAQLYAALEALNEAGGEYLLGGLENVAGGFTTKWAQGALSKLGKNLPKGTTAATAQALSHFLSTPEGRYIFSMGSEGFEEIVQGTVQNFLKNSMLGQNETLNPFTQDNLYSALIAALSAGTSNMVPYLSARSYGQTVDINAQDLRDNAANVSTSLTDYIGSDGNVDREAYDDAMAAREQMLQQADYLDQGGRLTNTEKAEAAAANGGRLGIYNEIGTESGLDNEQSYIQMAKRIADADATSENEAVHEASNKAFDNAMELAQKAKEKKEVSNAEKGRAAVEARNIEKAAAIEKMGREILEQAKRAEKAEALEARYEANAGSFKDYARENSAALYSDSSNDHMVSAYDGKVGMERYLSAYKQAYAAGFNDIESTVLEHLPSMTYLSNEQKLLAYKDGMLDANKYKQRKIEYTQGEAREGGLIKGAELVGSNEQKFLGWVGNKTGLKIEVVEGMKGSANIDLDKGVMRLNPYAENFVSSVSHELTHMIKEFAPKEYDKLQKLTVEALMKSRNADYETLYKSYEDSYRSNVNPDYTVSDILEEITADGATAYLNDAEFAERVASADRSLAQKIAEFFKGIADTLKQLISEKGVRKVGRVMRENEAQYRMAANTWFDALDKAAGKYKEGYSTNTDSGAKFQIKEFEDGTKYVLVDTDQSQFDGLNGEKLRQKVQEVINNKFSGTILGYKSDEPIVETKRGAKEYAYSKKQEKYRDERIAKFRASTELDKLLEVSKYIGSTTFDDVKDTHPEALGGFDYYETIFTLDDKNFFTGTINVMKQKRVNTLYDVTKIKSIAQNGIRRTSYDARGRISGDAFYRHNISSTKENGNGILKVDSAGNPLTNAQYKYFANSKVVDTDGNLKIMYHQTANEFTVFDAKHAGAGRSDYETPSGIFLKPNANDIGVNGKKQMALYANITNPLEFADRTAASAYWSKHIDGYEERLKVLNSIDADYQQKYEAAEEASDSKYSETWNKRKKNEITEEEYNRIIDEEERKVQKVLDEWHNATEKAAVELKDMINDYISKSNYDGVHLIKDSGSFGRSVETWIALKPEQVKNTTNVKPTNDADIRFQLNEPVEETRDLIAVRNVDQSNLASMLELEGLPSPSIAVTKADIGHTQFGDVTFIFGKDTIDPQQDKRNQVWDADSWTPTFPTSLVERQINTDKLHDINKKLYAYKRANSGNTFNDTRIDPDNFDDKLSRNNYDLLDIADNSYDLKLLYLDEKETPYKEFPSMVEEHPYTSVTSNENIIKLADSLKDIATEYKNIKDSSVDSTAERKEFIYKNYDAINDIYKSVTGEYLAKTENAPNFRKISRTDLLLSGINRYLKGEKKSETVTDTTKAREDVDGLIDIDDYHNWVKKTFDGVLGEKGIRNDKDPFTASGNRRPWNQLHVPYTAENIVKILWKDKEQGVSGFGGSTAKTVRGATARKFESINEMHERSGKLKNINYDEEQALIKGADDKLTEIRDTVYKRNGVSLNSRSIESYSAFEGTYDDALINAATKAKTAGAVKRYFAREDIEITDGEAKELLDTFNELRNLPTDYFEAKPKRVVDWNEIKLAVVPDNIDSNLVDQLKDRGINRIEFYPAGDDAARLDAENKATDLRFQLDIDDDPEWNYYTNMVRESSTELKSATDTLGELLSAIDYMPSDKAIERTAKRIKKYTATETSLEDIEKQLKTIFSYISYNNKIDGAKISDIAADYAGELITNSNSTEVDPAAEREYARLKNILKSYTFYVPDNYVGEIETLGGLQKLRREFFGTLNITRDKGISIDTMYQELSELYPDLFNPDIDNPADQLDSIVDKLRATKPKPVVSYANEKDFDAFRYYAGQEIFKAYIAEGAAEAGRKYEYRKLQNEYNKKLKANEKSEKEMAVLQAKAAEMQARYLSELEESRKKVTRQTMRERVYEARKSQKTRYWKNSILKDARDLSTWMLKPTDKNHVPEVLRQPLANFLTQLDLTSRDVAADGEPTQRSLYWMQLKDTWQRIAQNGGIAEGDGSTQYMVIDTDIINKMSELTDKIKGIKKLEELDYIDVLKLSDVMKAMKHSIENANKMISLNRSVNDVAKGTLDHLKEIHTMQQHGGILGIRDEVMSNSMLDADTRFHTFGEDAEDVYKAVRKGFNKKVKHTAEAAEWFADIKKELNLKDKDVNAWSNELHDFVTSDVRKIKISTAQIMNLYNLLMRTQARDHIIYGGITVTSTKANATKADKLLHRINSSQNVHVTYQDCMKLIGMLTPEQKLFAAKLQKTMSKMSDWGNETSMELMGYKKFNERNYWPIKSSRDFITTSFDQAAAGGVVGVAVKNAGPTQSTVKHANNPILIGDVFDVWSEHVNFMANYNAFTIPLTDMIKWYNYVDNGNILENEGAFYFKGSIKQEISRVFGKGADRYIMRFIEDINGMSNTDTSPFKPLISAFKGSAVGANLSVAIQQPAAFFRAMTEINPKYMIAGLKGTKTSWDTIKKYSAIAQWKDWGFFEIDTGKSMKQITTGMDTVLQSLNEKQMWLAGKGDEVTWKRLWASAEQQVKAKHPKLTFGSDEFYKATAEVFDNIIDKTQVVDSVFTKSDLMRSKSDLNNAMTSFFAEPTKSYNMLYRAWFDYRTAKNPDVRAKNGKKLATAIIAFTLSNAAAAMAKSIISAMRDKGEDRDKEFWDRWWDHAIKEFGGNMNLAGYFPYIKDLYSVFQGYDVSRQDMQAAKDLYYTATRWYKYFKGESEYTLLNNIGYSTRFLSDVTGVAIYGAKRDINALIDTVIEFTGNDSLRYEKDRLFYQKENASTVSYYLNMAMRAYKDGNTGLGDKIVQDMIKAGIPEDKIDEKKKEQLSEEEGMQTLIDAKTSGNEENTDEIRQQLLERGYTDEMIDNKLSGAVTSYIKDNGMSYKDMTAILDNITDYTASGYKEFNEVYSKWAEFEKDVNGWDDKKCRQQFRSSCTSYFKPLYKAGNATERSRILNILSRVKASNGDKIYPKEQDIKEWAKE